MEFIEATKKEGLSETSISLLSSVFESQKSLGPLRTISGARDLGEMLVPTRAVPGNALGEAPDPEKARCLDTGGADGRDDVQELRLRGRATSIREGCARIIVGRRRRRTADQEAVDIALRAECLGVGGLDAATVDDAHVLGHLLVDVVRKPLPDGGVNFLSLLWRGGEAGSDGPHGLVRDDDAAVVGGRQLASDGREVLLEHDLERLVGLSLFELLADAGDDAHAGGEGDAHFLGNEIVRLARHAEAGTPLAVPKDHPFDAGVHGHDRRDLAGESAELVRHAGVLERHADVRAKLALHRQGLQSRRRDHHLHVRRKAAALVEHLKHGVDLQGGGGVEKQVRFCHVILLSDAS
eukprot:scaffold501_cov355-Pinguiococcus_pyrenoidosus.AAC.3